MASTTDGVRHYLDQIGRVPLLDAEREVELSQQIEAGRLARSRVDAGEHGPALTGAIRRADQARDEFVRANLRLVVSIAKRYPVPAGMELLDLIQEGNLGLEHAVDLFDWRRGFRFSTYASFWIRQAIGRGIDQKGTIVRLPSGRAMQLRGAVRESAASGDGLDGAMLDLQQLANPMSLDRPIGDEPSATLGDFVGSPDVGPEDEVVEHLQGSMLLALVDRLEPRRRRAVELRTGLEDGLPRSYREVGQELGVTAEAARRLVQRALVQIHDDAVALDLAA